MAVTPCDAAEVLKSRDIRRRLQEAFEAAYIAEAELAQLIRINLPPKRLVNMVSPNVPLDAKIGELLFDQPEEEGYLIALVRAACRDRPRCPPLIDLATELGWMEALPGLKALAVAPATRGLVASYRSDIERASQRADMIDDLKFVHDKVDQLRRTVSVPLEQIARDWPAVDARLDLAGVITNFQRLRRALDDRVSSSTLDLADLPWIEESIAPAETALQAALVTGAAEALARATACLRQVVEVDLTALNGRIDEAVRRLDLPSLVARLGELRDELAARSGGDPAAILDDDLRGLAATAERLRTLVTEHTRWQRIDTSVGNLENALRQPVETVAASWQVLEGRIAKLVGGTTDPPAGLSEAAGQIARAILDRDQLQILIAFPSLSTILRDRFSLIDKSLLKECGYIRGVGRGLSAVVAQIGA